MDINNSIWNSGVQKLGEEAYIQKLQSGLPMAMKQSGKTIDELLHEIGVPEDKKAYFIKSATPTTPVKPTTAASAQSTSMPAQPKAEPSMQQVAPMPAQQGLQDIHGTATPIEIAQNQKYYPSIFSNMGQQVEAGLSSAKATAGTLLSWSPNMLLKDAVTTSLFNFKPEHTFKGQVTKLSKEAQTDWANLEKSMQGQTPLVAETIKFLPELVSGIIMPESAGWKMISGIDGLMSAARNWSEGKRSGELVTNVTLDTMFSAMGTKLAYKFTRILSPNDKDILNDIMRMRPQDAEDLQAMLQYMVEHKLKLPRYLYRGSDTVELTDPYLKDKVVKLTAYMDRSSAIKFSDMMNKISTKGTQAIQEITQKFATDLEKTYNQRYGIVAAKWDKVKQFQPKFANGKIKKFDITQLRQDIDKALTEAGAESSDPIRNKVLSALNNSENAVELAGLNKEWKSLASKLKTIDKETNPKQWKFYNSKLKKVQQQTYALESKQDAGSNAKTLLELIDATKLINNKAFVKGGDVSTSDAYALKKIASAKKVIDEYIMKLSDEHDLGTSFVDAVIEAREASKNVYETFGYSGGKNLGRKINAPEMGKILEALPEEQQSLFRSFMDDTGDPVRVLSKMQFVKDQISPETYDAMRRYYIESAMGGRNIFSSGHALTEVDPELFSSGLRKLMSDAGTRKAVYDIYGPEVFDNLKAFDQFYRDFRPRAQQIQKYQSDKWYGKSYEFSKASLGYIRDWVFEPTEWMYTKSLMKEYRKAIKANNPNQINYLNNESSLIRNIIKGVKSEVKERAGNALDVVAEKTGGKLNIIDTTIEGPPSEHLKDNLLFVFNHTRKTVDGKYDMESFRKNLRVNMPISAQQEMADRIFSDRNIETSYRGHAVQSIGDAKYMGFTTKMGAKEFLKLAADTGYDWQEKRSLGSQYAVDFLAQTFIEKTGKLKMSVPFLKVDIDTANKVIKVEGHEGRHRSLAMAQLFDQKVKIPVDVKTFMDGHELRRHSMKSTEWLDWPIVKEKGGKTNLTFRSMLPEGQDLSRLEESIRHNEKNI